MLGAHDDDAAVQAAQALYARVAAERASGRPTFKIHAGRVRRIGWRDLPARVLAVGVPAKVVKSYACPADVWRAA